MEGRRTYLKRTGMILLGLATVSTSANASGPRTEKISEPTMIIDVNRCMGCCSCIIACKDQNQTPKGCFNTKITKTNNGSFPHAWHSYEPTLCHQCYDAPCIAACEYNATFQLNNGIVVVDWNQCTGCGECVLACTYDARYLDSANANKVDKCDFCITRIEKGLEPACVESCPAGARIFGDLAKPQGAFSDYLNTMKEENPRVLKESWGRIFYTTARKG